MIKIPPAGALARQEMLKALTPIRPVLEIGPYDRPMVQGEGVSYFDVLDQESLTAKAADNPRRTGTVPFIEFVSPVGDMSVINRKFKAACSSHAVEHQPDLIKHLTDVGNILEPGGLYFLAVPDKRYCFDHYAPLSTVADVIGARGRKVHTLENVIIGRALHTHNDCLRHWAGDHEAPFLKMNTTARIRNAIKLYEASNGDYIDVHAWRFTPDSFHSITSQLYELGMSPLKPLQVYETPEKRVEFIAILQAPGGPEAQA